MIILTGHVGEGSIVKIVSVCVFPPNGDSTLLTYTVLETLNLKDLC